MRSVTINIPDDRGKLYEVIKYPAGEIQVRLTSKGILSCSGKDEYVIAANPIPDLIELAQLKSALDGVQDWYHRVLELMYLPYARADRRFVPGDSHGLQVFGELINALKFDAVYTFDVHSAAAPLRIDNLIDLSPIYHYDQITPIIKELGGPEGLCLIAPDKGAQLRYDLERFGPVLVGEKLRDQKTGKLSGFKISPGVQRFEKGLIVDDICDGGGTFVGLAKEIHRLNPEIELSLYVSHGIFSKGTRALFSEFKTVFISDFSFKGSEYETFKDI
jgi:ribose-phosphate pyrophosphokinase